MSSGAGPRKEGRIPFRWRAGRERDVAAAAACGPILEFDNRLFRSSKSAPPQICF